MRVFWLTFMMLVSLKGNALDRDAHRDLPSGTKLIFGSPEWLAQMKKDGLVALYRFRETSGDVLDVSGFANPTTGAQEPLDLTIDNAANVVRWGDRLEVKYDTLIKSKGPATKIIRECKASQKLTIEAWVKPKQDAEPTGGKSQPFSILTLSVKRGTAFDQLSSTNRNFLLGQEYDAGSFYRSIIRTTNSGNLGGDRVTGISSEAGTLRRDVLQHVVVTRYRDVVTNGREVTRMYLSYVSDTGAILDTLHREDFTETSLKGSFSNWDNNAILGLANEISYNDPAARRPMNAIYTTEQRAFLGDYYLVAIYCNSLEPIDLLGTRAPGQSAYESFPLNPNMIVTENHKKAAALFNRLAGVKTSLANPVIDAMAQEISKGSLAGWMAAADMATRQRGFYNITVRDFAARMSTRDEMVATPLNDFSASMVGLVRDDLDARQMLTGNFVYEGDPTKAAVPSNKVNDILKSNRHYEALELGRFNLADVLRQVPQTLLDPPSTVAPHPEPAGLLTTRAWMAAHAVAGTNRRPIEFAFREFLCVPIDKWADYEAPDDFVGRDVDRFPAGDHSKYTTSCRACHSVMDSLRGAYSFYNFNNGFTKYSFYLDPLTTANAMENDSNILVTDTASRVVLKLNHNDQGKGGRLSTNNFFFNNATRGVNASYFGWGPTKSGYGVQGFGAMISEAKAFPRCMARRVYRSVCKREPAVFDEPMLEQAVNDFVSSNYKMRTLFARIAVSPECIGRE